MLNEGTLLQHTIKAYLAYFQLVFEASFSNIMQLSAACVCHGGNCILFTVFRPSSTIILNFPPQEFVVSSSSVIWKLWQFIRSISKIRNLKINGLILVLEYDDYYLQVYTKKVLWMWKVVWNEIDPISYFWFFRNAVLLWYRKDVVLF